MVECKIRVSGVAAYVALSKGYEAVIDAADVPLVSGRHWHALVRRRPNGDIRAVYAISSVKTEVGCRKVYMHRVISDPPEGMEADHIDGNGLDNRRRNLRHATRSQNLCNQRLRLENTSGVKGVTWNKAKGKWCAFIRTNGKKIYLGQFGDIRDAAEAYAKASAELHGEFGRTATTTP